MNKKGLIGLVVGMFIGVAATLTMPATFAAVKEYMLTQAEYPIYVKGVEYKDPNQPILNYEGSTYVPLAKLGDLTGVNYRWNEELRRVEIGGPVAAQPSTGPAATPAPTSGGKKDCNIAFQQGATLCPDTVIERPVEPGYGGYPDSSDLIYQRAKQEGYNPMPPLLSEGWISMSKLEEIAGAYYIGTGKPGETALATGRMDQPKIHVVFVFSKEFNELRDGDIQVSGINIKRYRWNTFFKISDIERIGIL